MCFQPLIAAEQESSSGHLKTGISRINEWDEVRLLLDCSETAFTGSD